MLQSNTIMFKNIKLNKKGQTLVEVSIVFGITAIVVVSLVVLASGAIRQAQNSVRRTTASKMANAGIEAVVYHKNFSGFGSSLFPTNIGSSGCLKINSVGNGLESTPGCTDFVSIVTDDGLTYGRKIMITRTSQNQYSVLVTVNWSAGGGLIDELKISRIITNYE